MASEPPKVFISYSHDSLEHARRVLGLAERLRSDGVDAHIDQYVAGTPEEGWPRWMRNELAHANFVLLVCTETYYRRFNGLEVLDKGKGVDWEGQLATLELYNARNRTAKFVPIFFTSQDEQFIPESLSGHSRYLLDPKDKYSEDNYVRLYAFLTSRAGILPSKLGPLKTLAHEQVLPMTFGSADEVLNIEIPVDALVVFVGHSEDAGEEARGMFNQRVGDETWNGLKQYWNRKDNAIPLIALFPANPPSNDRMRDLDVVLSWADLLKKREELTSELNQPDARVVATVEEYTDLQDLQRIILEQFRRVLGGILKPRTEFEPTNVVESQEVRTLPELRIAYETRQSPVIRALARR
jgi:hypothetical protein